MDAGPEPAYEEKMIVPPPPTSTSTKHLLVRRHVILYCEAVSRQPWTSTLNLIVSSTDNFANSLDPDQARQNVALDLGPNCLTI